MKMTMALVGVLVSLLTACETLNLKNSTDEQLVRYHLPKADYQVSLALALACPETGATITPSVSFVEKLTSQTNVYYYIDMNSLKDWSKDTSLAVNLTPDGRLKSINGQQTDKFAPALVSLVSGVAKLALGFLEDLEDGPVPPALACSQEAQKHYTALNAKRAVIDKEIASLAGKISKEKAALAKEKDEAKKKVIQGRIESYEGKVAALNKELASAASFLTHTMSFSLTDSSEPLFYWSNFIPLNECSYDRNNSWHVKLKNWFDTEAAVCHTQNVAVILDSEFSDPIEDQSQPEEGGSAGSGAVARTAAPESGSKGIFYRQPVPADIRVVWVDVDRQSPAPKNKVLGQVLVPQLGETRELAIDAALFRGKTVKMELDARGGITKISSEDSSAIPGIEAGVNSLAGLQGVIAAARKAEEDEAKNEFDAESQRLQSELDYLKKLDELNTYKTARDATE